MTSSMINGDDFKMAITALWKVVLQYEYYRTEA
jgi:hypothetical protein